jgi:acetylornithine deacetylase/succinyl-diaminopimelate desuccinylase-like protein
MSTHLDRFLRTAMLLAFVAGQTLFVCAQTGSTLREQVRSYRASHEPAITHEFVGLLSIPNVASDTDNIRKNADHIVAMLQQRGVKTRLLEVAGAPPIVYGELSVPAATRTLAFYAHYDGQPVDPKQWTSPPWTPVMRDKRVEDSGEEIPLNSLPASIPGEWRIYARSAGDDKAPIEAMMTALDALRAAHLEPSVNLKFFFEGEEEAGSSHLPGAIQKYASLLHADAWLLCDGPVHQTRRMQVFFGARGVTDLEMTVYGPMHPLHSGHYGNWAPNPAVLIAELIDSMRDSNAHIKIAGYYDDVRPLTEAEKNAIRELPVPDDALRHDLGLAWSEGAPEVLAMRIMRPALNVRGIESGHVGSEAQNAVPVDARASIDFRLVPDQRPEKVHALVEEHIRKQGFYIVHQGPTIEERRAHARIIRLDWGSGYPPARTSMDLPASRAVVAAIADTLGTPVLKVPMLGGSIPMYLFTDVLHVPVIGVPIANHDDNQHGADENLRMQNLWDGIEVFAGLFADTGGAWK